MIMAPQTLQFHNDSLIFMPTSTIMTTYRRPCSCLVRVCPTLPYQVRLTAVQTGGGASNMNIHYDITGLLTVVWRSHSGQIVWAA